VYAPNWLGDTIMSMPAVNMFKSANSQISLGVIAPYTFVQLWEMSSSIDEIIPTYKGASGTRKTISALREYTASKIYIMPNSFKSAFIAFLAGIPERVGYAGHFRRLLLTDVVETSSQPIHQSHEYFNLMGIAPCLQKINIPLLNIPNEEIVWADNYLNKQKINIAVIPGAARGPSKRWPVTSFIKFINMLLEKIDANVILIGSPQEETLCNTIAENVTRKIINLAGKTSLKKMAALLSQCLITVCNDSGGMHLAAAVGSKVVAIYGITDPRVTGPLGEGHRIISAEGFVKSRNIKRTSIVAAQALQSIPPESVVTSVMELTDMKI